MQVLMYTCAHSCGDQKSVSGVFIQGLLAKEARLVGQHTMPGILYVHSGDQSQVLQFVQKVLD